MSKKQTKDQEHIKLQQQVEELTNNWKRAVADYRNLEYRAQRQQSEAVLFGSRSLAAKLLKVVDDLSLAAEHHPEEQWVQLIKEDLRGILQSEDVIEIDAMGKEFDPMTMECVRLVDGEQHRVVNVIQRGYKIQDQVLRPAKVEVGTGKLAHEQTVNKQKGI